MFATLVGRRLIGGKHGFTHEEKYMLEPLLLFLTETKSILVALTVVKVFNLKMFINAHVFWEWERSFG